MTDEPALNPSEEPPNGTTDLLLARVRSMPGRQIRRAWLFPVVHVAFAAAVVELGISGYLDRVWPIFVALALTWGPGICIWMRAERREARMVESLAACKE